MVSRVSRQEKMKREIEHELRVRCKLIENGEWSLVGTPSELINSLNEIIDTPDTRFNDAKTKADRFEAYKHLYIEFCTFVKMNESKLLALKTAQDAEEAEYNIVRALAHTGEAYSELLFAAMEVTEDRGE